MNNLIYKEIEKNDEQKVRQLIDKVLGELERPEFFIPYEEWELQRLFDKGYAPLYGAYDGEKLVGMAQLYIDRQMLQEFIDILGLNEYKVCELGGNLVLPEYRGMGIMGKLIEIQAELAKELDFDYVISMAHPDNIGSNKALQRLGLEYVKTTTVANGHLRNIYQMKLKVSENN